MDQLARQITYLFDGFLLDKAGGALFRLQPDSQTALVPLGSRAFQILCVLIERRGEIVTRQEIMDAVWPDVAVEEANLTVQLSALRRVLDADRTQGSCIQTIPGRGYRFVAAVMRREGPFLNLNAGGSLPQGAAGEKADDRALAGAKSDEVGRLPSDPVDRFISPRCSASPAADPSTSHAISKPPRPRRRWLAAGMSGIAIASLLVILSWQAGWFAGPHQQRPRLSIVVLPFKNLSDDPKDDYLADGITDDVTADLSILPGMFVIARSSAYTYKSKPEDPRKVGEELGVRYLLEGSIRRVDDTVRVNAQLISTDNGTHLWSDRFEHRLKDLNAGQEEIVRRIGLTLNVAMWDIESARSKRERPANPDAFDLILRARSISLHPMGPEENQQRIVLYEQALRLDPTSILAMMGLASALVDTGQRGDELDRAAKLVAAAAAVNPNHQVVLSTTAYLYFSQNRLNEAISGYQRLLDHYPNDHRGYAMVASCLINTGRADEAIPIIEKAIARSPRDSYIAHRYSDMGFAMLLLGRDEDAIVWTQRALTGKLIGGDRQRAQRYLRVAAAYARLGQVDKAHRAIAEANRLWPYDTVRSHWPEDPSSLVYAAQTERFQAALRLAGHRDHADEEADFGVASDDQLHQEDALLAGPTPMTAPGVKTIYTADLVRFLAESRPVVVDGMMYWWGRSIPGSVGLNNAGWGSNTWDGLQDRLRRKMRDLTNGDPNRPIVAVGWNSERFDGRNLALRLVAMGYTNVYWYRGGREAWEVNGLPEAAVDAQEW